MNTELRTRILLSVMRALLGEVFSSLRAVICFARSEVSILIVFYVDGAISEDDQESIEVAVTEVIADFPANVDISHEIRRVDAPERLDLQDGLTVYQRKEVQISDR